MLIKLCGRSFVGNSTHLWFAMLTILCARCRRREAAALLPKPEVGNLPRVLCEGDLADLVFKAPLRELANAQC
jgi:hypothetical protein